jgi:hypothetical protein
MGTVLPIPWLGNIFRLGGHMNNDIWWLVFLVMIGIFIIILGLGLIALLF